MAKKIQAERDPDRLRRSDRGAEQDEPRDRPRGHLDGAASPADGVVSANLSGLAVYKMTGSGNDFVMVDSRASAPEQWEAADIQAICARGTGLGADGLVFLGPGSTPGAV